MLNGLCKKKKKSWKTSFTVNAKDRQWQLFKVNTNIIRYSITFTYIFIVLGDRFEWNSIATF